MARKKPKDAPAARNGEHLWHHINLRKHPKYDTPEELLAEAAKYFEWVANHPLEEEKVFCSNGEVIGTKVKKARAMTHAGLRVFLNVGEATWHRWRAEGHLKEAVALIDDAIREQKFAGAAADIFNASIISRDLGLKDTIANEHTSPDRSMSPTFDVGALSDATLKELLAARKRGQENEG